MALFDSSHLSHRDTPLGRMRPISCLNRLLRWGAPGAAISDHATSPANEGGVRAPSGEPGVLRAVLRVLLKMNKMHRQRAALADLDDHLLKDIGLDRRTVRREAGKAASEPPERWRCMW